jgi:hypothetical protein
MNPTRPLLSRAAACGAFACLASAVLADTVQLRLGEPNGLQTPDLIGYNMAYNPAGSNMASFLRYSGADTVRLRLQARRPEDAELPEDGVAGESDFAAAVERFRKSSAEDLARIWSLPPEQDRGRLEELRRDGIEILACVSYSPNKFSVLAPDGTTDWRMAWDYWRRYYAAASELAGLGVRRIQIFNEPDHKESKDMSLDEYLRRMQLGTDAVQAALADAPGRGGAALEPLISAPVTANIAAFGPRTGRPDTRDVEKGWGEETLRNIHRRWNGAEDPAWSQFQQYAYQYYSMDAGDYEAKIRELRERIRSVLGEDMPVIASETNVRIAARYAECPETQDSPSDFAAFGQISAVMAGGPLEEIYFFRMTQSDNFAKGNIKKNGTHYVSNEDPFHHIGGTAKTAEIVRLLTGSFTGRRPLLAVEEDSGKDLRAIATGDAETPALWLASASENPSRTVEIDLSEWKPSGGGTVVVDEVSTRHHGDVSFFGAVPNDGRLTLEIPGQSVSRVRFMRGLKPHADVAAGEAFTWTTASGAATRSELEVGHRASPKPQTTLVYASFPAVPRDQVALLRLATENPNPTGLIFHVYAFGGEPWKRASGNFPHLEKGGRPVDQIEPRLVHDVGNGVEFAASLAIPPGQDTVHADLTPVLRSLPSGPVNLLVVREPRYDGDAGEEFPVKLTARPALQILGR